MKKILFFLVVGLLLCFCENAYAQGKKNTIKLLDELNNSPIIGAAFIYGSKAGTSDSDGVIKIVFQPEQFIKFSHVSYGEWILEAEQLKAVIESGILYRQRKTINIKPVTVIALRSKSDEIETLSLDHQDRLAHDGGALLNQTPLIGSIKKSGGYGFDPVLRGFKYDQLNIVIDGVQCALAACPNRMDPPTSQIAPNMIQNIEIFKGPHSLRYGGALGGTINFVPSPVQFLADQKILGRFSTSTESNGNVLRSEGMIGLCSKNLHVGFFGSYSKGNDYKDGNDISVPADFKRLSYGANIAYKFTVYNRLIFTATNNIAEDTEFAGLPMDLREDNTWLFNLKNSIQFNFKNLISWETSLYSTKVDHLMDNFDKKLVPRNVNAETDAETNSFGGRTEATFILGEGRLFAGADSKFEKAEGTRVRNMLMGPMAGKALYDNAWQKSSITKTGFFAEYQNTFSSFDFTATARLELNNAAADEVMTEFSNVNSDTDISQINPSFSIGGIQRFENGVSMGVWFGHAERSASITERFINYFPVGLDPFELLGNPELDQEVNNQIDFNINYSTSNTALSLDLFSSFLKNYISSAINPNLTPRLPASPGVRQFTNIDEAMIYGFEFSWIQKLPGGLKHQLSVAYTNGNNKVLDEPLPEIAPLDLRYTLRGSFLQNKLAPEITFRHVLKQDRISSSFGESETPSFSLIDLGISYRIFNHVKLTAGVQNLLDEVYYEHLNRSIKGESRAIYSPGRNLFASFSFDFM
ncbi:MAG: TonB-dependent receptor [Melioribacteraceae bacterium]|nr:TonB-dependent receptor [Melioribacteraceae bacterium]